MIKYFFSKINNKKKSKKKLQYFAAVFFNVR